MKHFSLLFLGLLLYLKASGSINKDSTIFRNKVGGLNPNLYDFFFPFTYHKNSNKLLSTIKLMMVLLVFYQDRNNSDFLWFSAV